MRSAFTQRMQGWIYCEPETFRLEGKAVEELLSRAVYNPIYSNKVRDKQEKQVTHTHYLIKAKNFLWKK